MRVCDYTKHRFERLPDEASKQLNREVALSVHVRSIDVHIRASRRSQHVLVVSSVEDSPLSRLLPVLQVKLAVSVHIRLLEVGHIVLGADDGVDGDAKVGHSLDDLESCCLRHGRK